MQLESMEDHNDYLLSGKAGVNQGASCHLVLTLSLYLIFSVEAVMQIETQR